MKRSSILVRNFLVCLPVVIGSLIATSNGYAQTVEKAIDLAKAAIDAGQYDEAQKVLEPLVRLGNVEALFYSGGAYLDNGQTSEARSQFEKAAKENHRASIASLGFIALRKDRHITRAKKYLLLAMEMGSTYAIGALASVSLELEQNASRGFYWLNCAKRHGHQNASKSIEYLLSQGLQSEHSLSLKLLAEGKEILPGETCPPAASFLD